MANMGARPPGDMKMKKRLSGCRQPAVMLLKLCTHDLSLVNLPKSKVLQVMQTDHSLLSLMSVQRSSRRMSCVRRARVSSKLS